LMRHQATFLSHLYMCYSLAAGVAFRAPDTIVVLSE